MNIRYCIIQTNEELDKALDMCYDILGQVNEELYGRPAWQRRLWEGSSPMVYAEVDGEVISAVLSRREDENGIVLGMVACKADFRRKGITRELMRMVEDLAKENGYKSITCGSKEDAFYKSCGYDLIFCVHGQNIFQKILSKGEHHD